MASPATSRHLPVLAGPHEREAIAHGLQSTMQEFVAGPPSSGCRSRVAAVAGGGRGDRSHALVKGHHHRSRRSARPRASAWTESLSATRSRRTC